ncbi:hypothetical protein DFH07DRAFT_946043 [Mycena maculata]|uniref:F-box domain-containing protein n=1 Tax=Mycena maculata TaxID=230809 RepID=A0AAD7MP37_9AGAR|nr:hypothetical protein DFH07DRAFT_946043 [Mycena maculata]
MASSFTTRSILRLRAPVLRSSPDTAPPEPAAHEYDTVLKLILALLDDKADLLSCSLVCRAWIGPARRFLAFRVSEKGFSLFSARNAQLSTTAQHLRLIKLAKSTFKLSELSGFRVLKSLELHMDPLPKSLPHLQCLESLTLRRCLADMTRARLEPLLEGLPALRELSLGTGRISSHVLSADLDGRPLITLATLSLDGEFSQDVVYALRTRKLSLCAPFTSSAYVCIISKYLHELGEELTTLAITAGLEQLYSLDLSRSSGVRHIAVALHVNGADNVFDIEPHALSFLVRVAKSCMLESITLYIIGCVVGGHDTSRISLTNFGAFFKAFMQTPRTRGVRKIEVQFRGETLQGLTASSPGGRMYECNPDLPARQRLVASLMSAMPEDGWLFGASGDRHISFLLLPSKGFYGL